eukprot:TRINITY_DN4690_c0_g1_i1.p1 TRINITY_DN4690_c0_g1~~TRINITY_DN4690_c0_g1_i1.p1  ORF type:complete len:1354 (+),score=200.49 TRINITY_DN4690_c0_g1_i1:572-4063(+)
MSAVPDNASQQSLPQMTASYEQLGAEQDTCCLDNLDKEDLAVRLVTVQQLLENKDKELSAASQHVAALRVKHDQIEKRLARERDEVREEAAVLSLTVSRQQRELSEAQRQATAAQLLAQTIAAAPAASSAEVPVKAGRGPASPRPPAVSPGGLTASAGSVSSGPQSPTDGFGSAQEAAALRKRLQVQQALMLEQMEELGRLRAFYRAQKGGMSSLYGLGRKILIGMRDLRMRSNSCAMAVRDSVNLLYLEVQGTFSRVLKKLPPPPIGLPQVGELAGHCAALHEVVGKMASEHGITAGMPPPGSAPMSSTLSPPDPWDPGAVNALTGQYTDCVSCVASMPKYIGCMSDHFGTIVEKLRERIQEMEDQISEMRQKAAEVASKLACHSLSVREGVQQLCDATQFPDEKIEKIGWGTEPSTALYPQHPGVVETQTLSGMELLEKAREVCDGLVVWVRECDAKHAAEKLELRKEVASADSRNAQGAIQVRQAVAALGETMCVDEPWYDQGLHRAVAPLDPSGDPSEDVFVDLKMLDGANPVHVERRVDQVNETVSLKEMLVAVLGQYGEHWESSEEKHKNQKRELRAELQRLEGLFDKSVCSHGDAVRAVAESVVPVRNALEELCEGAGLGAAVGTDPEILVGGPPPAEDNPMKGVFGRVQRDVGDSDFVGLILVEKESELRMEQLEKSCAIVVSFGSVFTSLLRHWTISQGLSQKLAQELAECNQQLITTQECLEATAAELEDVRRECDELAQKFAAAKQALAAHLSGDSEVLEDAGFQKTIEGLMKRVRCVELTAREKEEVSALLGQVKELAKEGAESTWRLLAAKLTQERIVEYGGGAGGDDLESMAKPSREVLDRMCYCHRCGCGPNGPPSKRCEKCGATLYYGLLAAAPMGKRVRQMWEEQVARWLEKRRGIQKRQEKVVQDLTTVVESAETRETRQQSSYGGGGGPVQSAMPVQVPGAHPPGRRPVPPYVRLDKRLSLHVVPVRPEDFMHVRHHGPVSPGRPQSSSKNAAAFAPAAATAREPPGIDVSPLGDRRGSATARGRPVPTAPSNARVTHSPPPARDRTWQVVAGEGRREANNRRAYMSDERRRLLTGSPPRPNSAAAVARSSARAHNSALPNVVGTTALGGKSSARSVGGTVAHMAAAQQKQLLLRRPSCVILQR